VPSYHPAVAPPTGLIALLASWLPLPGLPGPAPLPVSPRRSPRTALRKLSLETIPEDAPVSPRSPRKAIRVRWTVHTPTLGDLVRRLSDLVLLPARLALRVVVPWR
jgi:hypothetical protein